MVVSGFSMSLTGNAHDLSSLPQAKLLRVQLRDYESTPALLLRRAALDWLIIALAWSAMASFESRLLWLACVVVVASRLQALGALLHDACHSRVRSRYWLVVEAAAGWPIASTIAAMRYHHLRHHRYSGTTLDPYRNSWIERGAISRAILVLRGAMLPAWWTLRALVAVFALSASAMRPSGGGNSIIRRLYARAFLQDRSESMSADSEEVRDCINADLRQLIAQITVIGLAFTLNWPILEFYVVPWVLAGIFNAYRVLYEHAFAGTLENSRATVYESTNDHDFGFLIRATLFPHNLGLHRAHHLYPTASFVHLPKLTAEIERALVANSSL
jgi:fatty acid desaturase